MVMCFYDDLINISFRCVWTYIKMYIKYESYIFYEVKWNIAMNFLNWIEKKTGTKSVFSILFDVYTSAILSGSRESVLVFMILM